MGLAFWIRRTLTVFALVAAVLFVVSLMRGRGLGGSLEYSVVWGAITAAVFTAGRLIQSRRGQVCAICDDIPDLSKR